MATRELPTGTVTLVFTDIEGSTTLLRRAGDGYGELLATHHAVLRDTWAAHDGTEVDTEGDAFFVAFPRPGDALAAAGAAQAALAGEARLADAGVRVRMGVHTGSPHVRDGTYWGEDVHYAARLASAGHGGQVLVSATTAALAAGRGPRLDGLGEHALKDFTVPLPLFQLVHDGRDAAAFPPVKTLAKTRTNLEAPAMALVGRDADAAAVATQLDDGARLVTLTGPGGVGKTQLALHVANEQLDRRPDGVFLVPLASVTDPAAIAPAVIAALGIVDRPDAAGADVLADHLADRDLLLVLDNLEQLVDGGAALVAGLLRRAPRLRVLVTSQAPLRVAGEHPHALAPLPEADAAALFRARAGAAGLQGAGDAEVAAVCARLDGLPLALELAAARAGTLGLAGLLERLDAGVGVLRTRSRDVEDRHRSLEATLRWTLDLLDPPARELLDAVVALPGGADLELLTAVSGGDPDDLLDDLEALLELSLVRREDRRYRSPQALRHIVAAGDPERAGAVTSRILDAVIPIALGHAVGFMPRLAAASAWMREEMVNLVAVLEWAAARDRERHAQLTGAVVAWARFAGRAREVEHHLALAAETATGDEPWALAVRIQRDLAQLDRHPDVAVAERIVATGDAFAEFGAPALALAIRFDVLYFFTDLDVERAHELIRSSAAIAEAAGDPALAPYVGGMRAQVAVAEGDVETVEREGRLVLEAATPGSFFSLAHHLLADAALLRGDADRCAPRYAEALRFAWTVVGALQAATELDGVGMGLVLREEHEVALEVLAAGAALRDAIGLQERLQWWADLVAGHVARAEAAVGPQVAAAAARRGRERDAAAAVAHALRAAGAPVLAPADAGVAAVA